MLTIKRKMKRINKGQALLIVLLITLVGLTVGLSVVSRSLTNIKISTQTEESDRAFAAAEAGVEEALRLGSAPPAGTVGDASYTVQLNQVGGGIAPFLFPTKITKDEVASIWLVNHRDDGSLEETPLYPANGTISVCWGENTTLDDSTPAIKADIIYKVGSDYKIGRGVYDPKRDRENSFEDVTNKSGGNCAAEGKTQAFRKDIKFSDLGIPGGAILELLRLRVFYNETTVAVAPLGGASLPLQGKMVESTGTLGGISRKIKVFESYPSLPPIFDYVLFSGEDLIKDEAP